MPARSIDLALPPPAPLLPRAEPRAEPRPHVARSPARAQGPASPARFRAWPLASRATLVLSDVLAMGAAAAVFATTAAALGWPQPAGETARLAVCLGLALVVAGQAHGVAVHPAAEVRRLVLTALTVTVGAAGGALLMGVPPSAAARLALFGAVAGVTVPLFRLASRLAWSRARWWGVPTLVVASRASAPAVVDTLRRWPEMGLRPVALLIDGPEHAACSGDGGPALVAEASGLPVWGRPERGPLVARAYGVSLAVVALPEHTASALARDLDLFSRFFRRVLVMNCTPGARVLWTALPVPEGLVGYSVGGRVGRGYGLLKRLLDLASAALALAVLAPVLGALALWVRLDSPGPALFRQVRMGRGGRCFRVLKFRTMHAGAEGDLASLLRRDPALAAEYLAFHKLAADPRVTRAGRWLRRFSLDELPQLWNILRGQMSLVGPRAYLPREITDMDGLERVVLRTRPGLTGLWQVSGRNALSFAARVEVDVHYVQNASPWLDLYVLLRTAPVALTGEGAA